MGKGGTKFVADAVGVRAKSKGYTGKDMKKDMATYLETGVHPDVSRARREGRRHELRPLPARDESRAHCYIDFELSGVGQGPASERDGLVGGLAGQPRGTGATTRSPPAATGPFSGRLLVELFDDLAPLHVGVLRSRLLAGGGRAPLVEILAHESARVALDGRGARRSAGPPEAKTAEHPLLRSARNPSMRHSARGVLSVAPDGSEALLTLAPCLGLDDSHLVVGRVVEDPDGVLPALERAPVSKDGAPRKRAVMVGAGACGPKGEPKGGGDDAAEGSDPATRHKRAAEEARDSLDQALASGLAKRKKGARGAAASAALAAALGDDSGGDGGSSSDADSSDGGD